MTSADASSLQSARQPYSQATKKSLTDLHIRSKSMGSISARLSEITANTPSTSQATKLEFGSFANRRHTIWDIGSQNTSVHVQDVQSTAKSNRLEKNHSSIEKGRSLSQKLKAPVSFSEVATNNNVQQDGVNHSEPLMLGSRRKTIFVKPNSATATGFQSASSMSCIKLQPVR